jgi:hypothetical protein
MKFFQDLEVQANRLKSRSFQSESSLGDIMSNCSWKNFVLKE